MSRKKCSCGKDAILVKGGGGVATHCVSCNRELKMSEYLTMHKVPPAFHSSRLSDFRSDYSTDESLFISGPAGTGKTHLAVALMVNDIINWPFNSKPQAAFISMMNLLGRIKRTFSKTAIESEEEVVDFYCNVDNLYIDDIGVEQATDWALSLVYQIIDHRWSYEKRTVFTSNFNLNALTDKLDPRISSRIRGMCELVELSGKDLRDRR